MSGEGCGAAFAGGVAAVIEDILSGESLSHHFESDGKEVGEGFCYGDEESGEGHEDRRNEKRCRSVLLKRDW